MPQTAVVRDMNDDIAYVFVDVGDEIECYARDQEDADGWADTAVQRGAKDVEIMVASGLSYYTSSLADRTISEIRKLTDGLYKGEATLEGSDKPIKAELVKWPFKRSKKS